MKNDEQHKSEFESNPVITELISRLQKRRVIPFVGAGVSAYAGLPGWDELVTGVINVLEIDRDEIREKRDLLVAIEYLIIKGADKIPPILKDILKNSQNFNELPDLIKDIARIDVPAIYTTNWDNLLEEAYKYFKKPYTSVVRPIDLTTIVSATTPIIKYHGSINYPDTMVISESQYYERFGIDSPFDLRLRTDMMEYHILFLGYSLRDYNIRYIWNRTQKYFRNMTHGSSPCAYFVGTRPNEVFYTVLEASNIRIIELSSRNAFAPFVKYISKKSY